MTGRGVPSSKTAAEQPPLTGIGNRPPSKQGYNDCSWKVPNRQSKDSLERPVDRVRSSIDSSELPQVRCGPMRSYFLPHSVDWKLPKDFCAPPGLTLPPWHYARTAKLAQEKLKEEEAAKERELQDIAIRAKNLKLREKVGERAREAREWRLACTGRQWNDTSFEEPGFGPTRGQHCGGRWDEGCENNTVGNYSNNDGRNYGGWKMGRSNEGRSYNEQYQRKEAAGYGRSFKYRQNNNQISNHARDSEENGPAHANGYNKPNRGMEGSSAGGQCNETIFKKDRVNIHRRNVPSQRNWDGGNVRGRQFNRHQADTEDEVKFVPGPQNTSRGYYMPRPNRGYRFNR